MPRNLRSRERSLFDLEPVSIFEKLASVLRPLDAPLVESLLGLAIEIAREGREGRKIGTIFMLGDADGVLRHSRPLILDPLAGHPAAARRVDDKNLRGTIKELAQLDGAFVVARSGIFVASCRYLDAKASVVDLPFGLGARHMAAAAMSKVTASIGIVVSETATVRIFQKGHLLAEIVCAPKPRLQKLVIPLVAKLRP